MVQHAWLIDKPISHISGSSVYIINERHEEIGITCRIYTIKVYATRDVYMYINKGEKKNCTAL